jgi:hypothetical protein
LLAGTPEARSPGDEVAIDELCRRQRIEQERVERESPKPKAMHEAVAAAVNHMADRVEKAQHPIEQKRRLANVIMDRVADPTMDRVIANRAAEYVVEDGLPIDVLMALLNELDEADRRGQLRGTRGSWFNGVLKRRLRDHGIRERGRRQRPRPP